jgi:hypothetical protein
MTKPKKELDALAVAAKDAADRAGSAIDDALAFIAVSNERIADMESVAAKAAKASAGLASFRPF